MRGARANVLGACLNVTHRMTELLRSTLQRWPPEHFTAGR